ncbi:hypothetical protein L596_014062 [Steinernema carpocapsae]|uniref:Uncharacterized protein n=1 Tax=Steinernema carpocapsae TaxID=34508 RepID=A0A4U5NBM5_STECR|nr:hypothetical protein L596_014062 [Steinernema carpocapsae]
MPNSGIIVKREELDVEVVAEYDYKLDEYKAYVSEQLKHLSPESKQRTMSQILEVWQKKAKKAKKQAATVD